MSWGTIGGREELAGGTRRPLRLPPNQRQEAGLVSRGPRFFRARPADRTRCNWGLETAVTFCSFLRRRPSNLCPKIGFLAGKRPRSAARIPASPLIVRIIRGPRNGDRILGTKLGSQNSHFSAPNLLRGWSFWLQI